MGSNISAQLEYNMRRVRGFLGDRSDHGGLGGHIARTFTNPTLAEHYTITVAGTTTDGDYDVNITFDVTDVNGGETRPQGPVLHRFNRASAETDTQIAAALVVQLNLISSTRLVATSAAGVITIKFKTANHTNLVATTPPGAATMVIANTQTAGGVNLRIGYMVARVIPDGDANNDSVLSPIIKGITTAANIVGVLERSSAAFQDSVTDGLGFDILRKGNEGSVGRWGNWNMTPYTNIKPGDTPVVWVNEAGPHPVGAIGTASPDTDQLDLSAIVEFQVTGLAGAITPVRMKF